MIRSWEFHFKTFPFDQLAFKSLVENLDSTDWTIRSVTLHTTDCSQYPPHNFCNLKSVLNELSTIICLHSITHTTHNQYIPNILLDKQLLHTQAIF